MEWRSLAMCFRVELAFHAANNEGAGGTNVMEPRRITVGDKEYDGISGEIIRRHILENFVKLCQQNNVPLHDRCKGLVPDRGREPLKNWIQQNRSSLPTRHVRSKNLPVLDPQHYPDATKELITNCALCDVGGYLIALEEADNVLGVLKRDSCFEVGWLISEHPAIVDYTQHSAYDPDPERHNLFVQNMRIGIYGGVLRIDLDRIGRNDWWWLNPKKGEGRKIEEIDVPREELEKLEKENKLPSEVANKLKALLQTKEVKISINKLRNDAWEVISGKENEIIIKKEGSKLVLYQPNGFDEYALSECDRLQRIRLLLEAIKQWLLSPTFAKQTGWLQHQSGLLEGSIVLSKDGAAPFVSPIKFEIEDGKPIIKKNENYRSVLQDIVDENTNKDTNPYKKYDFNSPKELIKKINEILEELKCQESE